MKNLSPNNTMVALVCGNDKNHIMDTKYGYDHFCLSSLVPKDCVKVFVDKKHDLYKSTFHEEQVSDKAYFFDWIKNCEKENVLVIVSDHGNEKGLAEQSPSFSYLKILDAVNSNEKVSSFTFVWGQCNAGVYKILSSHPKIYQIAACDLTLSVSSQLPNFTWAVNIFIKYVYEWMFRFDPKSNMDLDEDGKKSLLDLFHYSSIQTHHRLLQDRRACQEVIGQLKNQILEKQRHIRSYDQSLANCPEEAKSLLNLNKDSLFKEIEKINEVITNQFVILYNEQTPWSCSPEKLSKIEFLLFKT